MPIPVHKGKRPRRLRCINGLNSWKRKSSLEFLPILASTLRWPLEVFITSILCTTSKEVNGELLPSGTFTPLWLAHPFGIDTVKEYRTKSC